MVLTPASSTSPGQFSVNGQRPNTNYFTVDGVSANVAVQSGTALGVSGAGAAPAVSAQGGTNSLVSVDALQEFKIETSTYAPEFGRTPGAQVSMVTRSGSNEYHGSLFEYFRDDALDAADYFVKRQNLAKPEERQHAFGGVFGGPIQRGRTFVFVSYEGLRLDQPRSAVTEVPSLASRLAASDALRPYFDAFPSRTVRRRLAAWRGSRRAIRIRRHSMRRAFAIDRTIRRRAQRCSRVTTMHLQKGRAGWAASASSGLNSIGVLHNKLQTLTAGTTWIVNPTISNDLRVNWSRNLGENFQFLDTFGGAVVLPAAILHPSYTPMPSGFQLNLSGTNAAIGNGLNSSNVQRQFNIVNALLIARARAPDQDGIRLPAASFRSTARRSTCSRTVCRSSRSVGRDGDIGQRQCVLVGERFPLGDQRVGLCAGYLGRNPALTLAYGVRWEVNPPPSFTTAPTRSR